MPVSSLTSSLVQLPAVARESRARASNVEVVERGAQRPAGDREVVPPSEVEGAKAAVELLDASALRPLQSLRSAQALDNYGNPRNNAVLSYLQAQNISVDSAPSGSELIVGIDIFV